jgi:RHH-type proline utilization regulon transcriptional repressor/proline dehydrogenase/delta 1-pyrroline-5-carboxylate dehydrogenase
MMAGDRSSLESLDALKFADEPSAIAALLARPPLSPAERDEIAIEAEALVRDARRIGRRHGLVEGFLQEFSLGTREGLALMCLAEALLRIPDTATRDRLIAEKIGGADWSSHLGHSDSLFVNASTWGLMLTGRLVEVDEAARDDLPGFVASLAARIGEPLIRRAITTAVTMMGEQFVLGRTIDDALARARREDLLCSFDMLGEGARTAADAERYERLYGEAIDAVGKAAGGAGPDAGHGISVKLSALSPRFDARQQARIDSELYPRLLRLAVRAAAVDIGMTIDAEEVDRLAPTLGLLERLAHEPSLGGWQGLGVVVQGYQKRATAVIDRLALLARDSGRRLMVRLVKGAYWDSEIKRAQIAGRPDYPVFTTKPATDLSYLVCARALIAAAPALYPQFATHNAHSLAAVRMMAQQAGVAIEHQRLHGMGEPLYRALAERHGAIRLRTYAPVGGHDELLPYLVRRLLENGANTSFVHALLDEQIPPERIVGDPIALVEAAPDRHPRIPPPPLIYGRQRRNPQGRDFSQQAERERIAAIVARLDQDGLTGGPIIGGRARPGENRRKTFRPADRSKAVGTTSDATGQDMAAAIAAARRAQPSWDAAGGPTRAGVLRAMGDALEARFDRLVGLIAREAGRTLDDGVAEVREAIDFCRYYALRAEQQFVPEPLPGPVGESNRLELHGRGVFACISPWNFPLSIFTGQIAAALAAGNAVIAKPAEQTPLIAAEAVRAFLAAGLDGDLLALLPGVGEQIGAALVTDPGISGVAFTGGTETARAINRALAARPGPIIPFIAETGGLNGLFIDTSALREQVVDDALASAFGSAGQRCSSLRILFVPREIADDTLTVLAGALATLVIGDPADPATDIGPVIDDEAHAALDAHVVRLQAEARIVARLDPATVAADGSYFGPVIAEIPTPDFLEQEVFGPILHVYRYAPDELPEVARRLAARGYGLTLGIHSRIESFADEVRALVPAGNAYVNRTIIGAVVGVQPFGGEGLSGTGPKAGGPHSLTRYAVERAISVNTAAQGGDPALFNL